MNVLDNSPIKLVLIVELINEKTAKIRISSINKDFVRKYTDNDFMYHRDSKTDFIIWSAQDFIFDRRQLRLPDEKNIKDNMVHIYNYHSEKDRYESLKKMYKTLENWSKTIDYNRKIRLKKKQHIISTGKYWYVM
ncbi:MAG: hypothetical protein ACOC3V_04150 [bacterium]